MTEAPVDCPCCHSAEIVQSRTRGVFDLAMRILRQKPYRCMECRKRFYVSSSLHLWLRERARWKRSSKSRGASAA